MVHCSGFLIYMAGHLMPMKYIGKSGVFLFKESGDPSDGFHKETESAESVRSCRPVYRPSAYSGHNEIGHPHSQPRLDESAVRQLLASNQEGPI